MSSIEIKEDDYENNEEDNYENLDDIEELNIDDYEKINDDIMEICLHKNSTTNNGGVETCSDCGIEIYKELSLEPEWRYYGDNDSKHSSDPSRCHIRKIDDKNIYKDIEKYNF